MNKETKLRWLKFRIAKFEDGSFEYKDKETVLEMFGLLVNVLLDEDMFTK